MMEMKSESRGPDRASLVALLRSAAGERSALLTRGGLIGVMRRRPFLTSSTSQRGRTLPPEFRTCLRSDRPPARIVRGCTYRTPHSKSCDQQSSAVDTGGSVCCEGPGSIVPLSRGADEVVPWLAAPAQDTHRYSTMLRGSAPRCAQNAPRSGLGHAREFGASSLLEEAVVRDSHQYEAMTSMPSADPRLTVLSRSLWPVSDQ